MFRLEPVQLTVELVPLIASTSRQDVLIKGYIGGEGPVDVVFAGRRARQVKPLLTMLQEKLRRARTAAEKPDLAADSMKLRQPVRIEGSWRPRFSRDDQGWETRELQLLVARWMVLDKNGERVTFGESPVR